jgi:hypothetical protein
MLLLSIPVMNEISRYLEYGWEWKTICKVINFKHSLEFEIYEIEGLYFINQKRFRELKAVAANNDLFKTLWLSNA